MPLENTLFFTERTAMADKRILTYYNISNMLSAGLPIVQAFKSAVSGLRGSFYADLSCVAEAIAAGDTAAESMARYPKSFDPLDVMLAEQGELSGNLDKSFKMLSNWYRFLQRLKGIIFSGMVLPILVLHIAAVAIPFIPFIFGEITFNRFVARIIIALCFFYVPLIATICIVRFMPKSGRPRRIIDTIAAKTPVLGLGLRTLAMSRYCRVFNMLYSAGLPIVGCTENSAAMSGNLFFADWVKGGTESAKAGNNVSEGFSTDQLPLDFVETWRTGEVTGMLEDITLRLADSTGERAEMIFTEIANWLPKIFYGIVSIWMIYSIFKGFGMIWGKSIGM